MRLGHAMPQARRDSQQPYQRAIFLSIGVRVRVSFFFRLPLHFTRCSAPYLINRPLVSHQKRDPVHMFLQPCRLSALFRPSHDPGEAEVGCGAGFMHVDAGVASCPVDAPLGCSAQRAFLAASGLGEAIGEATRAPRRSGHRCCRRAYSHVSRLDTKPGPQHLRDDGWMRSLRPIIPQTADARANGEW